jgi:hypothetical protein
MTIALARPRIAAALPGHPLRGIATYYWRKSRWLNYAILAEICLLAVVAQALRARGIQIAIPSIGAPPPDALHLYAFLAAVYGPLLGASALTMEIGSGKLEPAFYVLPVRARSLAAWLLFGAAGIVALLWIGFASLVWRPLGLAAPILWPAALSAASIAVTCALGWYPTRWTILQRLLTAAVQILILGAGPAAAYFGAPPAAIAAAYLCVVAASYPVAVEALGRARRGDVLGETRRAEATAPRRAVRTEGLRAPFRSPVRAQDWMESRHALMLPCAAAAISLGTAVLSGLTHWLVLTPLGLDGQEPLWGSGIQVQQGVGIVLTVALVAGPICAMLIGFPSAFHKSARMSDGSLNLFYATRPLTNGALVAAKMRAAAISTLLAGVAVLPALALCLLRHAADDRGHAGPLGLVLYQYVAPHVNARSVLFVLLALVVIAITTWRLQVETLCIDLIGRLKLVVTMRLVQMIAPFVLLPLGSYLQTNPAFRPWFDGHLPLLLEVAAGLKVTAGVAVGCWSIRKGIATARAVAACGSIWIAIYAALLAALHALLPAGAWSTGAIPAGVALLLPLGRVSLAPIALAWNRHR